MADAGEEEAGDGILVERRVGRDVHGEAFWGEHKALSHTPTAYLIPDDGQEGALRGWAGRGLHVRWARARAGGRTRPFLSYEWGAGFFRYFLTVGFAGRALSGVASPPCVGPSHAHAHAPGSYAGTNAPPLTYSASAVAGVLRAIHRLPPPNGRRRPAAAPPAPPPRHRPPGR